MRRFHRREIPRGHTVFITGYYQDGVRDYRVCLKDGHETRQYPTAGIMDLETAKKICDKVGSRRDFDRLSS